MKSFTHVITDEIGLHARPAGLLVKKVKAYASSVLIECRGKTADMRKLMAMMGLAAAKGDTVTVHVDGADEESVYGELLAFFQENL